MAHNHNAVSSVSNMLNWSRKHMTNMLNNIVSTGSASDTYCNYSK